MRNQKDRRVSPDSGLFTPEENALGKPHQERRQRHDRRIENLTLEERLLQFSEMPSTTIKKPK